MSESSQWFKDDAADRMRGIMQDLVLAVLPPSLASVWTAGWPAVPRYQLASNIAYVSFY